MFRGMCTLILFLLIATAAHGQPVNLQERLSSLNPASNVEYLRLGEEVLDEATGPDDIRLARTLFVLAMQIGRESSEPMQRVHGASAALALAAIAATDSERRWVSSMAGEIDPVFEQHADSPLSAATWNRETGLLAAEALGLARAGEGRLALSRLTEPGVRELLLEVTPLLGVSGAGGGVGLVERLSRGWPCPECGNERIIRRRASGGGVEVVRCPTCAGSPGPSSLSISDLKSHLHAELRLLGGSLKTWSAQVEIDRGEPLREPSASGLERFYRVDLFARAWRDGDWVRDPSADNIPTETPPAPESDQPLPEDAISPDQATRDISSGI
jgi:predicted RNA-binding Zn-ribbon protein involved in translation (DUF1610 family)